MECENSVVLVANVTRHANLTRDYASARIILPVSIIRGNFVINAIHVDGNIGKRYAPLARRTATRGMTFDGPIGMTVIAIVAHQASARYAQPGNKLEK